MDEYPEIVLLLLNVILSVVVVWYFLQSCYDLIFDEDDAIKQIKRNQPTRIELGMKRGVTSKIPAKMGQNLV